MMPAIRGENIPERAVMCENNTEGKEVRTVLRGKYKLTCYADNNHGELFNLKDDPLEKNNLWYKECKTKSMMLLELNKLQMKAVKPPAEKTGRW
jgi:hypothetical protein